MKKLLSIILVVGITIQSIGSAAAQSQSIQFSNQKSQIENFLKQFNLTKCFVHDQQNIQNPKEEVTLEVAACLALLSSGASDKTLPTEKEVVQSKLKNPPSRALAKYYLELYRFGLDDAQNPAASIGTARALDITLKIQGFLVPRFSKNTVRTFVDLNPKLPYATAVEKAMELNIISPLSEKRIGLKQSITRTELLGFLYKLSLIHDQDKTLFQPVGQPQGASAQNLPGIDILTETVRILSENSLHRDEFDINKAIQQAIKGIVNSISDPYTVYFTPEENAAFESTLDQEVEGIGALVDERKRPSGETETFIVAPLEGSPAEKAGILAGDIILQVDDIPMINIPLQGVVSKIKGKALTTVKLTIQRNGLTLNISIVRAKITIPAVSVEYPTTTIPHIRISQFNRSALPEIKEALQSVLNKNPKGIIVDVRNNPGGFLHIVLEILELFIEPNIVIVRTVGPENNTVAITTDPAIIPKNLTVVVLTNKGSASASEIFAGVLQENKKATIIGSTTFGKGTVQNLIPFHDGSSLKVTTAKWLTGFGKEVDKVGIKPDIEVPDNLDTEEDETLNAAISFILEKR